MVKTAILGPTGYTGLELIRILSRHPAAEVNVLLSRREDQPRISEIFPSLSNVCDLECRPIADDKALDGIELAFVALPHTVAMTQVPRLLARGLKVVDLSADYRLPDPATYEKWYGTPHTDKAHLAEAVYGLPEFLREQIREAKLVANPGCYPTAALIALGPLAEVDMIDPDMPIVVDAKSGASGAGRTPDRMLHFPDCNEGTKAYKIGVHRHTPEMDMVLSQLAGRNVSVSFVPHLLPMDRGILATCYATLREPVSAEALTKQYRERYEKELFVRVRSDTAEPSTKDCANTNFCDISLRVNGKLAIAICCIDNLVKGASGQAVQNMNIMCGLEESAGLL